MILDGKMRPFLKEHRAGLATFFLFFSLLLLALRFVAEAPIWFDLPQSDDNGYLYAGLHFFGGEINADWSPLYSFWLFLLYHLRPDVTRVYYLSMQAVGILLPLFSFLFLRRLKIDLVFSSLTAVFLLAGYAFWQVEPRVTGFAALVLVFLWWLTSLPAKRWQRLWLLALSSILLAYARPEFFLLTPVFFLIALGYFLKQKISLDKRKGRFFLLTGAPFLLLLLWWGIPFSGSRTIYAFGQHYAQNVDHCITQGASENMAWEEILARDFNDPKNMLDVLQANPRNFLRHLQCNLTSTPKSLLKVMFGSAWGSSWLLIRLWLLFILYRLLVHPNAIRERLIDLWQKDALLLPILSLGIFTLDILLIFPREHYLSLIAVILWLLGVLIFGKTASSPPRWRVSFALALGLFLIMPSLGSLFDFQAPEKPVLESVQTIHALELDEPLRLFASQPFQPSRSEVYFGEDYVPVHYKPAGVAFGDYITEHQPNIIIVTKDGWHFRDDASWQAFEADPGAFGFKKLPFDSGDQFGRWRIYQRVEKIE